LLKTTIEGAAAHAELLRGEPDVAVVSCEHFQDEDAFCVLE
jgi:hypothetical protein